MRYEKYNKTLKDRATPYLSVWIEQNKDNGGKVNEDLLKAVAVEIMDNMNDIECLEWRLQALDEEQPEIYYEERKNLLDYTKIEVRKRMVMEIAERLSETILSLFDFGILKRAVE